MTQSAPIDPASAPRSDRDDVAQRIVEATAELLTREGRAGVTTRAVAAAAGLQPPAIYRHFGDMEGLLRAVAAHGFAMFLASKQDARRREDPIEDLRSGFDLAVEFGLNHPALYVVMYNEPARGSESTAYRSGMEMLRDRVHRLAVAGCLRVDERLAVSIIHAMTRGAVLTWLSLPDSQLDPALFSVLREALVGSLTTGVAPAPTGPGPTARALKAQLRDTSPDLSPGERTLLEELLSRIARSNDGEGDRSAGSQTTETRDDLQQ